jgi:hypothetical protein
MVLHDHVMLNSLIETHDMLVNVGRLKWLSRFLPQKKLDHAI